MEASKASRTINKPALLKIVMKQKLKQQNKRIPKRIEADTADIVDIIKSRFADRIKDKLQLNLELLQEAGREKNKLLKNDRNAAVQSSIESAKKYGDANNTHDTAKITKQNLESSVVVCKDYNGEKQELLEECVDDINTETIKCEKCEMVLKITEFIVDARIKDELECKMCELSFESKFLMKEHQQTMHSVYSCSFCSLICPGEENYHIHLQSHFVFHKCEEDEDDDDEERPRQKSYIYLYKCNSCDDIFNTRYHLKKHQEVHAMFKYKCAQCNRDFTSLTGYKIHLRSHGKTIYTCDNCKKSFRHLPSYKRHVYNQGSFECEWCGEQFHRKCMYEMHLKKRQMKCQHCDSSFADQNELCYHMVTHEGNQLCDVCGKGLLTEDILMLHQMIEHNLEDVKITYTYNPCRQVDENIKD